MSLHLNRLFVYGFPSTYGGAGSELDHQIRLWRRMGIEVHIIPSYAEFKRERLLPMLLEAGVLVHCHDEWDALDREDVIFGFCNEQYLEKLPQIRQRTRRTVFINCMTWLFEKEKQRMAEGMISMFLFQNEKVKEQIVPLLQELNPDPSIRFLSVVPFFDDSLFPFVLERAEDFFGCGRISRQDADKYSSATLQIYEYFVAPVPKRGLFMGFDARSEAKTGRPPHWITPLCDDRIVSQQGFYKHSQIVLQPTDTTENWPRVGLEAMASGSVLIVDDRGGWQQMIEHGKSGWLCRHERDFIFYASKMAYEPELRREIARNARDRCRHLSGFERASESWTSVFRELAKTH